MLYILNKQTKTKTQKIPTYSRVYTGKEIRKSTECELVCFLLFVCLCPKPNFRASNLLQQEIVYKGCIIKAWEHLQLSFYIWLLIMIELLPERKLVWLNGLIQDITKLLEQGIFIISGHQHGITALESWQLCFFSYFFSKRTFC